MNSRLRGNDGACKRNRPGQLNVRAAITSALGSRGWRRAVGGRRCHLTGGPRRRGCITRHRGSRIRGRRCHRIGRRRGHHAIAGRRRCAIRGRWWWGHTVGRRRGGRTHVTGGRSHAGGRSHVCRWRGRCGCRSGGCAGQSLLIERRGGRFFRLELAFARTAVACSAGCLRHGKRRRGRDAYGERNSDLVTEHGQPPYGYRPLKGTGQ